MKRVGFIEPIKVITMIPLSSRSGWAVPLKSYKNMVNEQTEKKSLSVYLAFSQSVRRKEDTNPGLSLYIKQQ
jgi:hypothetical protein